MKMLSRAHFLHDFDIRTVQRADGERAIQGQLHVAGAGGFGAGGGNLLRQIGSGDDFARGGNIVVGQEGHFQKAAHGRIVVDDIGHVVGQLDDQLGHGVARCRLAGDNHGARHHFQRRVGADAVV